MALINWFQVGQFAPELAGTKVPVLAQEYILATVNQIIASPAWGPEDSPVLRTARLLYAAHMGTLEKRRGQAGASTSKSMGGMSESFGAATGLSTSLLSTTSYGQLYLTLAKTRAFRAGFNTGMVPNGARGNGGGWGGNGGGWGGNGGGWGGNGGGFIP